MVNLETLSLAELHELMAAIPGEIRRREGAERKALMAEMRQLAKARGFDFDDLVHGDAKPSAPAGKKRAPAAVKYRHPKDASLTWTGRGRKPAWVAEWEAGGKGLDALKV